MRKFRHLLGAIKNADAELLGSGGEVFFEDTKALRIAEMFCNFFLGLSHTPTVNFFSTRQDLNPTSGISGYGCNGMHR